MRGAARRHRALPSTTCHLPHGGACAGGVRDVGEPSQDWPRLPTPAIAPTARPRREPFPDILQPAGSEIAPAAELANTGPGGPGTVQSSGLSEPSGV